MTLELEEWVIPRDVIMKDQCSQFTTEVRDQGTQTEDALEVDVGLGCLDFNISFIDKNNWKGPHENLTSYFSYFFGASNVLFYLCILYGTRFSLTL